MRSRQENPRWELCHLAQDLTESRDLAAREPEKLSELRQIGEALNAEMAAPLFSP